MLEADPCDHIRCRKCGGVWLSPGDEEQGICTPCLVDELDEECADDV